MLIIIIDIIFIVATYFLWNKYGKDSTLYNIEFESYPPMDLNSAEVGQIYKGYSEDTAIASLVLCLANKGYLKIEKIKEEINIGTYKKKSRSFKISKLKEYAGSNENEQVLFNELFSHSDEITWNDLYDNFFIKLDRIKKQYEENDKKIYEENSLMHSSLILSMILILFIVSMFSSPLTGKIIQRLISPILLPLLYFIYKLESIPKKVFLILLEIPILLLCFLQGVAENTFITIFNISTITILSFFLGIMRKKTVYNTELFRKIIGFKKFLNKATVLELQELTNENPDYFYIVLPYAYALGIGNKLIKKFDNINLGIPEWFSGSIDYKTPKINRDLKITFEQIYVAMITHLETFPEIMSKHSK